MFGLNRTAKCTICEKTDFKTNMRVFYEENPTVWRHLDCERPNEKDEKENVDHE